jgi:hypothetical protein
MLPECKPYVPLARFVDMLPINDPHEKVRLVLNLLNAYRPVIMVYKYVHDYLSTDTPYLKKKILTKIHQLMQSSEIDPTLIKSPKDVLLLMLAVNEDPDRKNYMRQRSSKERQRQQQQPCLKKDT